MEEIKYELKRLIDMYWQIEKDHWEEANNPKDHIFHSWNNVRNNLIGKEKDGIL